MTPTARQFTLAQYLVYDDDTDRRYELVSGELVQLPPESDLNNQIHRYLDWSLNADCAHSPTASRNRDCS